jgi:hypothetical protein
MQLSVQGFALQAPLNSNDLAVEDCLELSSHRRVLELEPQHGKRSVGNKRPPFLSLRHVDSVPTVGVRSTDVIRTVNAEGSVLSDEASSWWVR